MSEDPVDYNYVQEFVVTGPMAELLREGDRIRKRDWDELLARFRHEAESHPKQQLVERLIECTYRFDTETAHATADDILLEIIDDPLVKEIFDAIDKWYA